jgi:Activator of Hsp90 ATPase homolog 1-like protein
MNGNFSVTITVEKAPSEAFDAISDVRGWWSQEIEGATSRLGDEFIFDIPGVHYSKIRLINVVPDAKVVWYVTDARIHFVENQTEWTDTTIVFELSERAGRTEVRFTHVGLVPDFECFDACTDGWSSYITGSLRDRINTGVGDPHRKDDSFESELRKHGNTLAARPTL